MNIKSHGAYDQAFQLSCEIQLCDVINLQFIEGTANYRSNWGLQGEQCERLPKGAPVGSAEAVEVTASPPVPAVVCRTALVAAVARLPPVCTCAVVGNDVVWIVGGDVIWTVGGTAVVETESRFVVGEREVVDTWGGIESQPASPLPPQGVVVFIGVPVMTVEAGLLVGFGT